MKLGETECTLKNRLAEYCHHSVVNSGVSSTHPHRESSGLVIWSTWIRSGFFTRNPSSWRKASWRTHRSESTTPHSKGQGDPL